MKTALFTNFTSKEFIGYWDGKEKKFAPGQSVYMPDYLAEHFAKHLTNRELLEKGLERSTSPKKPKDVPEFMEIFNKAYTPDDQEVIGDKRDDLDTLINVANKNKEKDKRESKLESTPESKLDPSQPQVIVPPDFDDDGENTDESTFEEKPLE